MSKIVFPSAPIASREVLAKTLSLELKTLEELVASIPSSYRHFPLKKKNSSEFRNITAPKPFLMNIQKRINARIFSACIFPSYLQGSIRDKDLPRDFLSNAKVHASADTVITLDVKDFYPSIKEPEVFKIFKYLFHFKDEVSSALTALVTLNGSLPQGAPTSSYIANMIFHGKEHKLVAELRRKKVHYTRLLDDITLSFSGKDEQTEVRARVIGLVRKMCTDSGLKLHDGKQKIIITRQPSSPAAVVTGITLKRGKVGLPREYRAKVRSKVNHCLKLYEAGDQTTAEYHKLHNSTLGDVTLLKRLGYSKAEEYAQSLKDCEPTYSHKKIGFLRRACMDLAKRLRPSTVSQLTRRYYVLTHCLNVMARTQPTLAKQLRKELREAFSKAIKNV